MPGPLVVLTRGFAFGGMLQAAWRYRRFILSSIRNEYRIRFARSKLGGLWMVVHPLINAAIFALVLAEVMSVRLPGMTSDRFAYALYVSAGMLAWSLFAEVVTRCLTVFIDRGGTLKKLYFPRICLPLIVTGTALLNNVLMFGAIVVIFGVLGHPLSTTTLWVPVLMLLPLALGLGLGLVLGVLNVFARDVGQVVPVLLQLAFWFTPVIYMADMLPAYIRPALDLNPMASVVESYQNVMVTHLQPLWTPLAWTAVVAAVLLAIALLMFRRASAELVDAL
jgi:lipopolysaccharide transport system permease protein